MRTPGDTFLLRPQADGRDGCCSGAPGRWGLGWSLPCLPSALASIPEIRNLHCTNGHTWGSREGQARPLPLRTSTQKRNCGKFRDTDKVPQHAAQGGCELHLGEDSSWEFQEGFREHQVSRVFRPKSSQCPRQRRRDSVGCAGLGRRRQQMWTGLGRQHGVYPAWSLGLALPTRSPRPCPPSTFHNLPSVEPEARVPVYPSSPPHLPGKATQC